MAATPNTIKLVTAAVIAVALTLTGCAQTLDVSDVGEAVTAKSMSVNETEVWVEPGASFTTEIGVRLYVNSDDPRQITRTIRTVSPAFLDAISTSKFKLKIQVVLGHSFTYADYFSVKKAALPVGYEVSEMLGVAPSGTTFVTLTEKNLVELSGR